MTIAKKPCNQSQEAANWQEVDDHIHEQETWNFKGPLKATLAAAMCADDEEGTFLTANLKRMWPDPFDTTLPNITVAKNAAGLQGQAGDIIYIFWDESRTADVDPGTGVSHKYMIIQVDHHAMSVAVGLQQEDCNVGWQNREVSLPWCGEQTAGGLAAENVDVITAVEFTPCGAFTIETKTVCVLGASGGTPSTVFTATTVNVVDNVFGDDSVASGGGGTCKISATTKDLCVLSSSSGDPFDVMSFERVDVVLDVYDGGSSIILQVMPIYTPCAGDDYTVDAIPIEECSSGSGSGSGQ